MTGDSMTTDMRSLQQLRQTFHSSLHSFAASPSDFWCLRSYPATQKPDISSPLQTLYVLDSSFNPPTVAHRRIAEAALTQEPEAAPKRLLLLLATQNADKPTKPAPFEDRLVMMSLFAQDLQQRLRTNSGHPRHSEKSRGDDNDDDLVPIDIGITKKPYFNDKAISISDSHTYPASTQQVHLTGYDTFVRIFDAKYYAPEHTLARLEPFLSRHRLRVTYRPGDSWGGKAEQDRYLENLANGGREAEGGKREWASQIKFVDGRRDDEEAVSSTKARQAIEQDDASTLEKVVAADVKAWIVTQGLYRKD